MKLDPEDIRTLVDEVEEDRADYKEMAVAWENMWRLMAFEESDKVREEVDQVEQIATADPYNIIQLLTRFVSNEPRIEIPYLSATDDDDERSTKIEEWITAFHTRNSRQQSRNVIEDMTWMSGVRGRGALQVLWVRDILPERLQDKRLPILMRTLDPLNVGIKHGPLYTEYAYHKYLAKPNYIKQAYPKYELAVPNSAKRWHREQTKYEIVDFWYVDDDGAIWHAVTINASMAGRGGGNKTTFAKRPYKTLYPEIPIIEWTGDGAPLDDELSRSLSILHPLRKLWPAKCKAVSHIATAMKYYTNPLIVTKNLPEDIEVGPGAIIPLNREDQDVDVIQFNANIPIAQTFLDIVEQQIGQATFPPVMFGDSGNMQAGYGVNILAQQARGRINSIRSNMESALEKANELILSLVEVFGEDKGVEIWGGSSMNERKRPINISKKDIKGNYANEVTLIPEIPTDETQRITTWLQLVREQVISKGTFRDRILNVALPRDEDLRVSVEQSLLTPELAPKKALRSIQKWYGTRSDWEQLISGTPLDEVYQQEMAWKEQQAAEREANKVARAQKKFQESGVPPAGYHVMPDGTLMSNAEMQQAGAGMPPLPPTLPPGPPPFPGAPMPLPPGMPPGAQPPGLPGMPPAMAGQLTPQQMGVTPQMPPGMTGQINGDPEALARAAEEEALRQGGPPPMPPGA